VKQNGLLTNFVQKVPSAMLEVAGDLHQVPAYFENPVW